MGRRIEPYKTLPAALDDVGPDKDIIMRRTSLQGSSSPESPADGVEGDSAAGGRRGQIAAQACETCRLRKTRCDEKRPKCGLCTRLDLPCVYREPRPTKRDKTQAMMLATVQRIDKKVDRILAQNPEHLARVQALLGEHAKDEAPKDSKGSTSPNASEHRLDYSAESHNLRGALSVFPWPAIKRLMAGADNGLEDDLDEILRGGSGWLVRQEMLSGLEPLSADTLPTSWTSYPVTSSDGTSRTVFPELTADKMDQYADAYFGSFNIVYPILDRASFLESVLPTVKHAGFGDGCLKSLIALLVFGLGIAACEGEHGTPISEGSGIRGGIGKRPPALDIFNEARKRIGLVLSSCSLENAQAMLMAALFYESCSRHMEFWRMTVTASAAIKAVLLIETNLDSRRIDMLRRTYWICNVIESWYYFDLNLPRSDVESFEECVALPDFDNHLDFQGNPSVETRYQYNFLSMVSLRRLIHRVFEELHDPHHHLSTTEGDKADNQALVIAELSRQLTTWRTLLPPELHWEDGARADCRVDDKATAGVSGSGSAAAGGPSTAVSVPGRIEPVRRQRDQDFPTIHVDVLLAQLRCRYYYTRFMVFRPFVYKALHTAPDQLALLPPDTVDGFVIAVDSMLQWPVAYQPVRSKKRLIPNIFVWTQSFMMFLLILRAVRDSPPLWQLCERRVGAARIEDSVAAMLEWIADMRQVDGVAAWAWRILRPLYGLAE